MNELSLKIDKNVKFVGVDISENAIQFAKNKFNNFEFYKSDLSNSNSIPKANIYFWFDL